MNQIGTAPFPLVPETTFSGSNMRISPLMLAVIAMSGLRADEGMWTFDNIPAKAIKAKYGVELIRPG